MLGADAGLDLEDGVRGWGTGVQVWGWGAGLGYWGLGAVTRDVLS